MNSAHPVLIEVCCDSAAGAVAAQEGGADRVELCANLLEGGVTPSAGAIAWARQHLQIPMMVLIRPRGGDFVYSEGELDEMRLDIEQAKSLGAQGVVFGMLEPDGQINVEQTRALVAAARPMQVTFHRAFDMCVDPLRALDQLIDLGVDRVLTSGQRDASWDGIELLTELVARAGDRILVMPGGGILESTILDVVQRSGAREVHFAAGTMRESTMRYRNPGCTMGNGTVPGEYEIRMTDADLVRRFIAAARPGS